MGNVAAFDFVVELQPQFGRYADAAMLRLQSLYPSCRIVKSAGGISVALGRDVTEHQIRKDILHAVYREKIYAETLAMRNSLVAAVTSR